MKQKVLLIIFGIFIAVLLGEGVFRIGGLIISERKIENYYREDRDTYRILCIGDSSTYGLGPSDANKFSYPSQLQKLLDENIPDKRFEVFNLGVPGINSSQVVNRLRKNISNYNPDMIIVMVGINDPWNLEESNLLKFYNQGFFKKLYTNLELLLNRLKIYQFIKLVYISNKFESEKSSNIASFPEQELKLPFFNDETRSKGFSFSSRHPTKARALYNALSSNIIKMNLIAKENRIQIMFMKYHNSGWGRPEKIIHETYPKLNAPIVDNEILFKTAEDIGLNVRGADGWHPNDLGYLLIAKNIYNKMVSMKFVDGKQVKIID